MSREIEEGLAEYEEQKAEEAEREAYDDIIRDDIRRVEFYLRLQKQGNNCRILGFTQGEAKQVLEREIDGDELGDQPDLYSNWRPSDYFWDAYLYGTETEIQSVESER